MSWLLVLNAARCAEKPALDGASGILVRGSMMCSECWAKPFCLNATTGEFLARAEDGCPNGFVASVQASRVTTSTERVGEFHCVAPEGKEVDGPPSVAFDDDDRVHCESAADPLAHQNVDVCQDVPTSCRRPPSISIEDLSACAAEQLPDQSEPKCPTTLQLGPERLACGSSESGSVNESTFDGVFKLVDLVSVFGQDVPNGDQPERYCFLSCFSTAEQRECDPDTFAPASGFEP